MNNESKNQFFSVTMYASLFLCILILNFCATSLVDTITPNYNKSTYLGLSIAIYILGIFFIVLELIASHGITGVLGILGILGGMVLSYFTGPPVYTASMAFFTVIVLPISFYIIYKKLQLKGGLQQQVASYSSTITESYQHLLGKQGISLTTLRPSGIVIVDNKKIDAISERDVIEKGTSVKVVKVEGIRIVVRKTDNK